MRKDIRTLLSTVHEILPKDFYKWTPVGLGSILDNKDLRKIVVKAKLVFHTDKLEEKFKVKEYLFERIFNEINNAFKDYRANKHNH